MAETIPTQIRLDPKRLAALKATAAYVGLITTETHRLALDYGLPVVRKRLGKKK